MITALSSSGSALYFKIFIVGQTMIEVKIQCPLGFATLGKAAALGLATSRAVTDLRQYINSDLGFSDLEI